MYAGLVTDIGDSIGGIWDTITGPAAGIGDGIAFASDPLGWTFGKTQEAVVGLTERVLPWLMNATKPDLTADWFLNTYRMSFGLAVMVWLLILLGRLVAVSRGRASGADLLELLTTRSLTFIGGAMWGPAVGWVVVEGFHALAEGILGRIGGTTDGALSSLLGMVKDGDWKGAPGGLVFATGLLVCILIALTLVLVMMVVALVALYLTGVIFPIGWVWVTDDPSRRPIAYKVAWTWLGLNASPSLLLLLLGASFAYIGNLVPMSSDPGLKLLVNGVTALIVMVMVAFSPALLFKFAPVLPTSAGQSVPSFGTGGGSGGDGGSNDLRQVTDNEAASDDAAGGIDAEGTAGGGGVPAGGGGAAPPGPLESEAMNASPVEGAGGPSMGGMASSGPSGMGGGLGAGDSGGADAVSEAAAGEGTPGAGASTGAASTAEASEVAGAGASVGEAAEVAGAAGAAESATGVGAVIGIPTLIGAVALEAGSAAVQAGGKGADMAAADVSRSEGEGR